MVQGSDPQAGDDQRFADDLRRAAEGDAEVRNRLWAEHYEMLRDCAKAWFDQHWRRQGDQHGVSLTGTEVAHAVYERLFDRTAAMENGRAYFFRAFYTECLRIVVEHWRKTRHEKGRGERRRVELPSQFVVEHKLPVDFGQLFELCRELERLDARTGQVAMLKVFENRADPDKPGAFRGLTNSEVAAMLGIGLRTVEQDWAFAKAWLLRRITGGEGEPETRAE